MAQASGFTQLIVGNAGWLELTVALSSTLMEWGSATLCLLRACSSCCKGGHSHFPKTTRSISLEWVQQNCPLPLHLKTLHHTGLKSTLEPSQASFRVSPGWKIKSGTEAAENLYLENKSKRLMSMDQRIHCISVMQVKPYIFLEIMR